ncbi:MAG: type II toxin-antitoxin system VapC family toxin [Chloroflexi bacterium]|nr:type II toxin-antitoxin system VapC family toxin [Chloroflexota bacterium]
MTEIPARVIDASVAGAIVFREPRRPEALSLVRRVRIFAPNLLPYELVSIARTKTVREPDTAADVALFLSTALDEIDVILVPVDFSETLRLALETGLSTYDASYLFVSLMLDALLVTFDNRLKQAHDALA